MGEHAPDASMPASYDGWAEAGPIDSETRGLTGPDGGPRRDRHKGREAGRGERLQAAQRPARPPGTGSA